MVRHGETELNSALRYWGKSDVKLSALGLSQAERLRDRLAFEKIDAIYSSSMVRARVTAEIIASGHRLSITECPELCEVDFGKLEGLTFEEIKAQYQDVAKLWIERSPALEYPGGESRNRFYDRVCGFTSRLGNHRTEETILIVAHSGVLRTLICRLLGVDLDFRWQMRLDLASLSTVEVYLNMSVLTLLNDVSHLR
jgi:broad specificity phosphatase PhoE